MKAKKNAVHATSDDTTRITRVAVSVLPVVGGVQVFVGGVLDEWRRVIESCMLFFFLVLNVWVDQLNLF